QGELRQCDDAASGQAVFGVRGGEAPGGVPPQDECSGRSAVRVQAVDAVVGAGAAGCSDDGGGGGGAAVHGELGGCGAAVHEVSGVEAVGGVLSGSVGEERARVVVRRVCKSVQAVIPSGELGGRAACREGAQGAHWGQLQGPVWVD